MHKLPSGNWIQDLELTEKPTGSFEDHWSHSTEVVGSKEMVAAVMWERTVLFWEVAKGDEMKQLNSLYLGNLRCYKGCIQVCGTKAAILARGYNMGSLIVMENGKRGLVKKTLAKFTLKFGGLVAFNSNFIAVAKRVFATEDMDTRISLWRGDKRLSEVVLPGRTGHSVTGIILEAPYVVLSLFAKSLNTREGSVTIKVYSVSSSNRMEEVSSKGSLLKSIPLTGTNGDPLSHISRFVFNDFIIGYVQQPWGDGDIAVHILDKKLLVNPKVSAEGVWVRRINLPYDCTMVNINNTSLVCAKDAKTYTYQDGEGHGVGWDWNDPKKGELYMISFWMRHSYVEYLKRF